MSVVEWVSLLIASIGIVGNFLNVKKNIIGFWLWAVADVLWIVFDIYYKHWFQAGMFFVYLFFAIWGILEWRKKKGK